jgi:hypothetical protein
MKLREPDQKEENDSPDAYLDACAKDLIDAVHSRDIKKMAQVLKDTFELMESQPHKEGEHIEEESEEIE